MSTKTSSFGVSKREGHDSSDFYSRNMFNAGIPSLSHVGKMLSTNSDKLRSRKMPARSANDIWYDQVYCHTSEDMFHVPDNSIHLAFTSPPYNVGKTYDNDMDLIKYLELIMNVGAEVYRTLVPGGRYIINIANLGRKPYIPLHAYFYMIHTHLGFLPAGEIIWQKQRSRWLMRLGSWMSARSPRLRDLHEYLLVFVKDSFSRPDRGESDISREEFMESTLSIWQVAPESAKRVGHPAPFSVELASRVIKLFSYVNDIVLDPFVGSGTTCVAAKKLKRHYVGYDIVKEYCDKSLERLRGVD